MADDLKIIRAESIRRGKMLIRMRDALINVRDGINDEGDLTSFGSTNDADTFRDVVEELDGFKWDLIVKERGERCIFEVNAQNRARADKAEAHVADLLAAAKSLSALADEIWFKASEAEVAALSEAYAALDAAIAKAEGRSS